VIFKFTLIESTVNGTSQVLSKTRR